MEIEAEHRVSYKILEVKLFDSYWHRLSGKLFAFYQHLQNYFVIRTVDDTQCYSFVLKTLFLCYLFRF